VSDPFQLEPYLHEHIPLTKHLALRVDHASTARVQLIAPLEPNLNHRRTGFGGSISALAILAGWSLLWCRLRSRTGGHKIVIQQNSIEYLAPVTAEFSATCNAPATADWERFDRAFQERGRARIDLEVDVCVADMLVARFAGRYVVLQ
jgi:thioesterase domain-containing protein